MKIAKGLGGYRVPEVDSYIIRLLTDYQKELDDLKAEVDSLLSENGRLAAEIRSASEELEAFKTRSRAWVAAEAEARRSARQMEETAKREAEQVMTRAQAEIEVQKAYLATLDSEIEKAKQEVEAFVESIRAFLSYATPKETAPAAARPASPSAGKVAGWIPGGPGAEDAAAGQGFDGSLKVNTAGEALKVVAQNGAVIGQVSSLVMDGASGKVTGYELTKSAMPGAVPDGTLVPASCVVAVRSSRVIVDTSLLGGVTRTSVPAQVSEPEPETTGYPQPEGVEARPPEEQPCDRRAEQREAESDVEEAIRQHQVRYVVGKIAGRDLVGDDGSLVVRKGQEITRETVERAVSQGRLAELVVYMVTPGMSPDEIDANGGPEEENLVS